MDNEASAESLVDELARAGGWPEPRLLSAILDRKSEAVPPLLDLIRGDLDGDDRSVAVGFAVDLLGCLGDPSAIPDLINLLHRTDDDDYEIVEAVQDPLADLSPQDPAPVFEVARARALGSYPRDAPIQIALDPAGDAPAA